MWLPVCCFQVTGLYEYKVFGELPSCPPDLCADVYMDLTYRKDWDQYAKGKLENSSSSSSLSEATSVPPAVESVCLCVLLTFLIFKHPYIVLLVASLRLSSILQVKGYYSCSV